jgi:hypothetical protein
MSFVLARQGFIIASWFGALAAALQREPHDEFVKRKLMQNLCHFDT